MNKLTLCVSRFFGPGEEGVLFQGVLLCCCAPRCAMLCGYRGPTARPGQVLARVGLVLCLLEREGIASELERTCVPICPVSSSVCHALAARHVCPGGSEGCARPPRPWPLGAAPICAPTWVWLCALGEDGWHVTCFVCVAVCGVVGLSCRDGRVLACGFVAAAAAAGLFGKPGRLLCCCHCCCCCCSPQDWATSHC